MSAVNVSSVRPAGFVLIGFPGLDSVQQWLSIPFTIMFIFALAANSIIVFVVKHEQALHTPMYFFLSVLAVVDIGLCTTILPNMLQIFRHNPSFISFEACFIQMFFIYFFTSLESSILVVMAYDRYVAICNPLRYTSILSTAFLGKIFSVFIIRGLILTSLIPIFASMLLYCSSNIISHCYCDHMAVAKLACTDITNNSRYGISVAFSILGVDVLFITFTYVMILRVVLKLGSNAARLKAFNTCGSHLFIIMYFYITSLFNFLVYRMGEKVPPHIHVLFAVLYLLVPPVLNPIIYAVKTKEIRQAFLKHVLRKKVNPATNIPV